MAELHKPFFEINHHLFWFELNATFNSELLLKSSFSPVHIQFFGSLIQIIFQCPVKLQSSFILKTLNSSNEINIFLLVMLRVHLVDMLQICHVRFLAYHKSTGPWHPLGLLPFHCRLLSPFPKLEQGFSKPAIYW